MPKIAAFIHSLKIYLFMSCQVTVDQLHHLRLNGMAHAYAATIQLPTQQQPNTHEILTTIIDT